MLQMDHRSLLLLETVGRSQDLRSPHLVARRYACPIFFPELLLVFLFFWPFIWFLTCINGEKEGNEYLPSCFPFSYVTWLPQLESQDLSLVSLFFLLPGCLWLALSHGQRPDRGEFAHKNGFSKGRNHSIDTDLPYRFMFRCADCSSFHCDPNNLLHRHGWHNFKMLKRVLKWPRKLPSVNLNLKLNWLKPEASSKSRYHFWTTFMCSIQSQIRNQKNVSSMVTADTVTWIQFVVACLGPFQVLTNLHLGTEFTGVHHV